LCVGCRSPGEAQVIFGSVDEERWGTGNQIQAFEIRIAAIHHIEGSGLEEEIVQSANVVLKFASGDKFDLARHP
jgi:hypothetical protein